MQLKLQKVLKALTTPAGRKRLWMRMVLRGPAMNRRKVLLAVGLVLLIISGSLWLGWGTSAESFVQVSDKSLSSSQLATARRLLSQRGIKSQVKQGRLLVAQSLVPKARKIIQQEVGSGSDAISSLKKFADGNDIWASEAQNLKRWQAAKMSALSELISQFTQVEKATVMFEAGSPKRLGKVEVPPHAAVHLVMDEKHVLTGELVTAIADLIVGSVSGMQRRNVRIIDSSGKSFVIGDEDTSEITAQYQHLKAAEQYYAQKIKTALRYIDGLIVTVSVAKDSSTVKCSSAAVTVPRSYLLSLQRKVLGADSKADTKPAQTFAAAQLGRIQRAVMNVIGTEDSALVKVDWYYDEQGQAQRADSIALAKSWLRNNYSSAATIFVLACGLLCGIYILKIRRRSALESPQSSQQDILHTSRSASLTNADAFRMLQQSPIEDIVHFIQTEHPQTIALVLSHLSSANAAEVFAALPAPRQVDVTRRIANLDNIDPDVVREIAKSISQRLGRVSARGESVSGGLEVAAEILRHAGYAAEKNVLEALGDKEPDLADSIRHRLLAFEDITHMPIDSLGPALEKLESDSLAVALRTANEELKQKVFSCLSGSAANQVRQQMQEIGPVRLSDVEAAQNEVIEAIRLVNEGTFISAFSNDQSEIVA